MTTTSPNPTTDSPTIPRRTAMTTAVTTPPRTNTRSNIRPQRFTTLLSVELRKLVDTRTGKALVGLSILIPLAALIWMLTKGNSIEVSWQSYSIFSGVLGITIPLIALFAMTSEWTQRTALTTFTLSPRRGRVLAAKFLSSFTVAMAMLAVVIAMTLGAVALGGLITGQTASFDSFGTDVRGLVVMTALQVIMAAGFGALAAQTAVAVAAFLVAPSAWALLGTLVLGGNAQWLDVFAAYGRLASSTPLADLPQTITAITVWVVLPATIGVVRSLRREVK